MAFTHMRAAAALAIAVLAGASIGRAPAQLLTPRPDKFRFATVGYLAVSVNDSVDLARTR